jgi:hypothetical protein
MSIFHVHACVHAKLTEIYLRHFTFANAISRDRCSLNEAALASRFFTHALASEFEQVFERAAPS